MNNKILKPFKAGPGARWNKKVHPPIPLIDELMAACLGEEKDGVTAAQIMLRTLRLKAPEGDVRATELEFDRG
ncbi:MAG TPA: hypothetical protein VK658_09695 [Chryseolinea sp.]|nr:hypothetical protein [Chryseolinea sp.]